MGLTVAGGSPIIEVLGARKIYGGAMALDGVDFRVITGSVHALLGENGAGKSTLVKALAGAVHLDGGVIRVRGTPAAFRSPRDSLAAGVGVVTQELSLFPALTVAENLIRPAPGKPVGVVDWRHVRRHAVDLLQRLELDIDPDAPIRGLPVGDQQMIEIARVIFSGAGVIVLDEPTSALSHHETRRLFTFVHRLAADGVAVVLVTHSLEDVMAHANELTVLKNGRVTLSGPLSPRITKEVLVHHILGRESSALERTYEDQAVELPARSSATLLLETVKLSATPYFEDVSLTLRSGEILGVYGDLASGLNQLAECLFGRLRPERGSIRVKGAERVLRDETAAKRAGIGYVPADRRAALALKQSVMRNMTLAYLDRLGNIFTRGKRELDVSRSFIAKLGIRSATPAAAVESLSGGNQQKVLFARWLIQTPDILVLLEPTRGMDVGAKGDVLRIIAQAAAQGVGVLLMSAEPEMVLANAHRILALSRGRIVREFAACSVSKSLLLRDT